MLSLTWPIVLGTLGRPSAEEIWPQMMTKLIQLMDRIAPWLLNVKVAARGRRLAIEAKLQSLRSLVRTARTSVQPHTSVDNQQSRTCHNSSFNRAAAGPSEYIASAPSVSRLMHDFPRRRRERKRLAYSDCSWLSSLINKKRKTNSILLEEELPACLSELLMGTTTTACSCSAQVKLSQDPAGDVRDSILRIIRMCYHSTTSAESDADDQNNRCLSMTNGKPRRRIVYQNSSVPLPNLEFLLFCFLSLNEPHLHQLISATFLQVLQELACN